MRLMRARRDERGVALVTVLFVGAVMTVTVSAAAVIAVTEFRAAGRDRGATSALALAEAGVDRTMQWMRSNRVPWRYIVLSGCTGSIAGVAYNTVTLHGQIGTGSYTAQVTRADNCTPAPTSVPSPRSVQSIVITSTGCTNNTAGNACPTSASKRVVRQQVALSSRELPVGVSASRIDARGNPTFQNIIVIARGIVNTRQQVIVSGTDPYYEKEDFYPCASGQTAPACFPADTDNVGDMRASVHSTDRIWLKPNGTDEHAGSINCSQAQYVWDGSATGGTGVSGCGAYVYPNRPSTSLFTEADADRVATDPRLTEEDHLFYRQIAQSAGLYCGNYNPAASNTCTRAGAAATVGGPIDAADVTGLPGFYVVYVEFPAGGDPQRNILTWNVSNMSGHCTSTTAATAGFILIVRNGSVEINTSSFGAIFAEDGRTEMGGNTRFEGTVATQFLRTRGSPTFCNSQRWVDALPGAFINVIPTQWSEVDR